MRSSTIIATLFLSLYLFGCSCPVCEITQNRYPKIFKLIDVPESMKNRVENYIAERTGEEFFVNNIRLNEYSSYFDSLRYYWVYDISIPGKEWANGKIELFTDSLGNPDPMMDVVGIPPCNSNPEGCAYSITPGAQKRLRLTTVSNPASKSFPLSLPGAYHEVTMSGRCFRLLPSRRGVSAFRGSGRRCLSTPPPARFYPSATGMSVECVGSSILPGFFWDYLGFVLPGRRFNLL